MYEQDFDTAEKLTNELPSLDSNAIAGATQSTNPQNAKINPYLSLVNPAILEQMNKQQELLTTN